MKYFIDTEFLEGTQKGLFKETRPTIDLISIGIIAEDGREYYAISKDFNLKEAWNRYDEKPNMNYKPNFGGGSDGHYNPQFIKEYWLRDNVLKPIYLELLEKELGYGYSRHEFYTSTAFKMIGSDYKQFKYLIKKYGKTNKQISEEIIEFCTVNESRGNGILEQVEGFKDTLNRTIEFYGYYSDYDWVAFCWLFGKMIDLPKVFPKYCIDLKQDYEILNNRCKRLHYEAQKNDKVKSNAVDLKDFTDYPKQTSEHNALSDARWNKQLYEFLQKI